ncbi:MAG: NUDIX hydrolase [Candidatus Eremiobacteraeota bacterium]|nr:NUDIX hydrolase [Candidatus Eremiobacteraeota bacterium]
MSVSIVRSTRAFAGNRLSVRIDEVEMNGKRHAYEICEHPGGFAILALPTPSEMVLVKQYRHATGGYLWELPAGTAEPHEDPRRGAMRELREETGYIAGSLRELFQVYTSPGVLSELLHLFLAEDLRLGDSDPDEGEDLEVRVFPVPEVWNMLAKGELCDAKTLVALLWLRSR